MKKIILSFVLGLGFFSMYAQTFQANKRDSVRRALEKEKTDTGRVLSLARLSELYVESNADTAMKLALEALELSRRIRFTKGEAISLHRVGSADQLLGNYPNAMEEFLQALTINENIRNKDGITRNLLNIGLLYTYMEDYRRALDYNFQAKTYAEQLKNKVLVSLILGNISTNYNRSGMFDSAKLYAQQAFDIANEINDPKRIGFGARFLANAYFNQGLNAQALEYYHLSIHYSRQAEADQNLCDVYWGLARLFRKINQTDSAVFYAKQALELAQKRLFIRQIGDASRFLSNYYRSMNNKDSAFFYQDITVAADDSLYSPEKLNHLRRLAVDEKLRQREQTAAAEKSRQQQTFFAIGGAGALLLFLILVQLRIRSVRKKEKEKTAHVKLVAELELQSLRAQLNPHFMFNSLNAIQELILKEDFENSHTYLARFAKLLRMLLENAERPFIPLRNEINFLELYLALENLRIPDLHYSITTDASINTQQTLIPNMILQPYLENALWHGLSPKQGNKQLLLKIHQKNGTIVYDVQDNGIGRKKAAELKSLYRKEHKSKGMELLTKRFKLLSEEFGSDIKTEVTDIINRGEAAGTIVSIIVPNTISNLKYQP